MMTTASMMGALTLGIAGSLHCIGMCGPLALALPANPEASPARRALGRLVYNVGRAVTYACMGVFAGVLGHAIRMAGVLQVVSITLGVLLLVTVFVRKNHLPDWMVRTFYLPVQKGLQKILRRGSLRGLFQTGLLNGLLPCGLVYAALAGASLQQGALQGAFYMFLFGIGTIPLMFILSVGGLSIRTSNLQPVLNRLIPAVTCTVALLLILRGLSLGIPYLSPVLDAGGGGCCPH